MSEIQYLHLFKINYRNARTRCEICSNLKAYFTPFSSVSIVYFEYCRLRISSFFSKTNQIPVNYDFLQIIIKIVPWKYQHILKCKRIVLGGMIKPTKLKTRTRKMTSSKWSIFNNFLYYDDCNIDTNIELDYL